MKKRIFVVAVIAICLSIVAYGTIAYFTGEDTARNVITSGAVDISIEEWQLVNDDIVPYPDDETIEIMPGTSMSKIAIVRNNDEEGYIRAKLQVVIKDTLGKTIEFSNETLESLVTVAVNSKSWSQKSQNDGWWYYDTAVDTGEATDPLFEEVVFSGPNMTNEYQNCTVEVVVHAQAVQTANNGNNALEATGWSAE